MVPNSLEKAKSNVFFSSSFVVFSLHLQNRNMKCAEATKMRNYRHMFFSSAGLYNIAVSRGETALRKI